MSVCDFSGRYDIGADVIKGFMSVECSYPSIYMELEETYGIGDLRIDLTPVSSTHFVDVLYPESLNDICIPAVDRVIALWYVFSDYTVTIDGKTFGYVYFK